MPGPRCGVENRAVTHMCTTRLIPVSPRVVAKLLFVSVIPIPALDGRASFPLWRFSAPSFKVANLTLMHQLIYFHMHLFFLTL